MQGRTCGGVGLSPYFPRLTYFDEALDMVETEERKLKEREEAAHEQEERDAKAGKGKQVKHQQKVEHHEEAKGETKSNHIMEPKNEKKLSTRG